MKVKILNRWNGTIIYSYEVETEYKVKGLGLAAIKAVKEGVSLDDASLDGAFLDGAFLNDASLNRASLIRASLIGASLTRASLTRASLDGASLDGAFLDDAFLDGASLTRASLTRASLDDASLNRVSLSGASLDDASLNRVSLSGASLDGASLIGASLNHAFLDDASLIGAKLPSGIPIIPNIHQVLYEALLPAVNGDGTPKTLEMSLWHTCETTHCVAGHIVTMAGPAGACLEGQIGTGPAAALIIQASDPSNKRIPNFHATNEEAWADIKRRAGDE